MSMFEKILGARKKSVENNQGVLEAQIKEKLKSLVYDDSLVEELTPIFLKLNGVEGFSTVLELLETKEKQIETISGGDWFKQESLPDSKTETKESDNSTEDLVDSILSKKYKD